MAQQPPDDGIGYQHPIGANTYGDPNAWVNKNGGDVNRWTDRNGMQTPLFGGEGAKPGQAAATANQYGAMGQAASDSFERQAMYAQQNAPTIDATNANADRALGMGARDDQAYGLSLMQQAAEGRAPSAAEAQMGQGVNAALAAQMAAANSARGGGGNIALARRDAANAGSAQMIQANDQAAQLRAQEMAAARGAYSSAAGAMRGQDLSQQGQDFGQGLSQAQLDEAQRGLNLQAGLGYGALANQAGLGYAGLANQVSLGQLGADTALMQAQYGARNADAAGDAAIKSQIAGGSMQMIGGALGGAAMSDARAKHGIRPAGYGVSEGTKDGMSDARAKRAVEHGDADSFLESLRPYSYAYTDSTDEPRSQPNGGRYLGVLAQDVESTPLGQQMIRETPRGKAIETAPALSGALAGLGRLHERVAALETKKGGR